MSTINSSDVFPVQRGSTLYKVAALDIADALSSDIFPAQRGSLQYKVTALDAPDVANDDWFIANRAGVSYKVSGFDFSELFTKPTIDFEITLTAPDLTFELRLGITVPTFGTMLGKVSWGDGSPIETITQVSSGDPGGGFFTLSAPIMSHTYAAAGTYTIRYRTRDLISPFFFSSPIKTQLRKVFNPLEGIRFGGNWGDPYAFDSQTELREVRIGAGSEITSLVRAFKGCTKLEAFNVAGGDLSNVTNINLAFSSLAGTSGPGFSIQGGLNLRGLTGSQGVQFETVFGQSKVLAIGAAGNPVLMPTAQDYSLNYLANFTGGDNGATSLTAVYFDTLERCTSMDAALAYCRSLTTFSVANSNMSKVTSIYLMFASAGTSGAGFTIQGGMNWRGLTGSQGVQFGSVFAQSKVLSIGAAGNPVLMPTAQDYSLNYFANLTGGDNGATSLTGVYFDTLERCTSMTSAFAYCRGLATFSVANGNMSKVTSIFNMFPSAGTSGAGFTIQGGMNWRGLTGSQGVQFASVFSQSKVLSIGASGNPVLLPTAQNYSLDFFANLTSGANGAELLTTVYFDTVRKCTSMSYGFANCYALSTFLVTDTTNGFDELSASTSLTGAFIGCALTQASVDHILLLCVNGGQSTVTLNLNGGTSATPSATGLGYKATLLSRGWTVVHNALIPFIFIFAMQAFC